jgi:hypothetical protein
VRAPRTRRSPLSGRRGGRRTSPRSSSPAAADAEAASDLRLLAGTRVALAQVSLATGDRAGARELLDAADRWYRASGAGDDAALAADLLAGLNP